MINQLTVNRCHSQPLTLKGELNMDMRDACKILELSGVVNAEDIKKAYRKSVYEISS